MSNDLKYVLLPSVEETRRPPKFQPWYRERIKMKYPCNMNTRNWKFVKDGLDDFRDGLPPPHDDIILEPEKGPGPVLISEVRRVKSSVSKPQDRLKEQQVYYSKALPAVERRRETLDNYISTILTHPMAFFEHFNKTLPPPLYERLTKILEAEFLRSEGEEPVSLVSEQQDESPLPPSAPGLRPETSTSEKDRPPTISPDIGKPIMNDSPEDIENEIISAVDEEPESKISSTRFGRSGIVYDEAGNPWNAEEYERKQKNPYRWFIEKEREKETAKGPTAEERAATAMEERLHNVSEKFCNWLYDLGGEKIDDIDSAVVRNLFSTAYDTKPSLSVPIKIVEMSRVPVELRDGAQDTMFPTLERSRSNTSNMRKTPSSAKSRATLPPPRDPEPHPPKYRYGAWYLPKHLWKRSLTTTELRDPKIVQAELQDETRKQEEDINSHLAPLHGVDAFKEFLQERNFRRLPKLIADVENYRRNHAREVASATTEAQAKRTIASAP